MLHGTWAIKVALSAAICISVCACALHVAEGRSVRFVSALEAIKDLSVNDQWKTPELVMAAIHGSHEQVKNTNIEYIEYYKCSQGCPSKDVRIEYKFDGWLGSDSGKMNVQANLFTQRTITTVHGGTSKDSTYAKLSLDLARDISLSRTDVRTAFGNPDNTIRQMDPWDRYDVFHVSTFLRPKHEVWFHIKKSDVALQDDNQITYDSVVIGQ